MDKELIKLFIDDYNCLNDKLNIIIKLLLKFMSKDGSFTSKIIEETEVRSKDGSFTSKIIEE